jgi:hypothetical protein
MNCAEVRENLSGYIDEMLDKQIRDMVDQHLSACKACREELESIRRVVEELKNVGKLQAPVDFLETFHERLHETSFWTRIKELLFVPAQIKIPLELATVCIVAVLIFSLYSVYSPQNHRDSTLQDFKLESTRDKGVILEMKSEPLVQTPQTEAAQDTEYVEAAKQEPIELALILVPEAGIMERSPAEEKKDAPVMAVTGPAKQKEHPASVRYKTSAPGMALQEGQADETVDRAQEDTDADTLNEAYLKRHQEFVRKVHELVGLSGGRILSEEIDQENKKDQIILAEIPVLGYQGFVDKVTDLAQIQEPLPSMPVNQEIPLLIRIRLIPGQ